MKALSQKPLSILLIEDNRADASLTTETLKDSAIPNMVHLVKDAAHALTFLIGKNSDSGSQNPDLILLDLNIPVMNGFDFLIEIKKDTRFKDIPVFILSSSSEAADIMKARNLGASSYFVKPLDLEEFESEFQDYLERQQFRMRGT